MSKVASSHILFNELIFFCSIYLFFIKTGYELSKALSFWTLDKNDCRTMLVKWSNFEDFFLLGILHFFIVVTHHCEVITYERYCIIRCKAGPHRIGIRAGGGGESRAANSDRGLVLGEGMSRRTGSRARPRRVFFSDSDSDSDEAFQISRKLGLVHVEFFCVLVQQLWIEVSRKQYVVCPPSTTGPET